MLYSTCFTNWEIGSEKLRGFLKSHSLDLNLCLSDIRIHDSKPTPPSPLKIQSSLYSLFKNSYLTPHRRVGWGIKLRNQEAGVV